MKMIAENELVIMPVNQAEINYLQDEVKNPTGAEEIILVKPAKEPIEQLPTTLPDSVDKTAGGEFYVEGWILDSVTVQPIPATTQLVYIATGKNITAPFFVSDGNYSAWVDGNPDGVGLKVTAPGYRPRTISLVDLAQNSDIDLTPGEEIPVWIIIAIVGAIAIYSKRSGKVSGFTTSDLMPIFILVGGIIGFSVIKKVLEKLGLWESQDTKDLDTASTDPNSFWNPNYWQTIKPENKPWTYAIHEQEAYDWCVDIYDAFGPINDNEEQAIAVFKRCKTKANASFLCWVFQKYWHQDLLAFLRGGWWPQDRLSDEDVNVINKFIQKLPAY